MPLFQISKTGVPLLAHGLHRGRVSSFKLETIFRYDGFGKSNFSLIKSIPPAASKSQFFFLAWHLTANYTWRRVIDKGEWISEWKTSPNTWLSFTWILVVSFTKVDICNIIHLYIGQQHQVTFHGVQFNLMDLSGDLIRRSKVRHLLCISRRPSAYHPFWIAGSHYSRNWSWANWGGKQNWEHFVYVVHISQQITSAELRCRRFRQVVCQHICVSTGLLSTSISCLAFIWNWLVAVFLELPVAVIQGAHLVQVVSST